MDAAARVILVTGANKGIGYEIVRALLRDTNDMILVGARDETRGNESVAKLQSEFPDKKENVSLEIIDVGDEASRFDLAKRLSTKFGRLDVVIHNAAIAAPGVAESARSTFAINYFGLFRLNDLLLPLLKKSPQPRIIILTSGLAQMTFAASSDKIKKSLQRYETIKDVDKAAEDLVNLAEQSGEKAYDVLTVEGYGVTELGGVEFYSYSMSKLLLNARVKVMKAQPEYKDMLLEMVCPGYCATDINGYAGYRTAEKGGETPAWLAVEDFEQIKKREKQVYWTDKEQLPYFITAE